MFNSILRFYRNVLMVSPRNGILGLAFTSRVLILVCLVIAGVFMFAIYLDNNTDTPYYSPKEQCKSNSIQAIESKLEKELTTLNCSITKVMHSIENNRNSLMAALWPILPLFAFLLTISVFLFNVAMNTYKHFRYITYHISTQTYRYKVTGTIRIMNQNEVSESVLKAYFFDYSGKECMVSEIPFPHPNGQEASVLAAGESIELNLMPVQAKVARAAPNKIDIVLSAASGKITCVRGKEYWKPKQISQL
ncbi:hypothetical protein [Vibrio cyclitrophicus]|uniref:hypothetical protein n=1 Tax=Vibrio cyclitrophicus TaxID=47951 RepID=UPI0032E38A9D